MNEKVTLLPQYLSIVQDTSLSFYNKSTNILDAVGSFLSEVNENIKFNKSLVTVNMLSSYGILFDELNKTNFTVENFKVNADNGNIEVDGTKMMNNSFKMFFVEKYLSLSNDYKQRIDNVITNNQYFKPFSDDIGYITDTYSILDNNVIPYFDTFGLQHIRPSFLPPTTISKVSRNNLVIALTFNNYTDPLLKTNLAGLQTGNVNDNTAKTSHGTNLITDILYYDRAVKYNQAILNELHALLGKISDFIMFFKGFNPQDGNPERKAVFYKYTITNMENLEVNVDALKNNLSTLQLSSKFVLGVQG